MPADLPPRVRARLDKLAALAFAGVGGEARTADVMLRRLLATYGLTFEDFAAVDTALVTVDLPTRDEAERELAQTVTADVLGTWKFRAFRVVRGGRKLPGLRVEVPAAAAAMLRVSWDVYRAAHTRMLRDATRAFLLANRLGHAAYRNDDPDESDETPDERTPAQRADDRRVAAMSLYMNRTERPVRRLTSGEV